MADKDDNTKIVNFSGLLKVGDRSVHPIIPRPVLDDVPCPYVQVRTPEGRRLGGLQLIHKDLGQVQSGLRLLVDQPDSDDERQVLINQSLLFSAVITYGKCFAQAKGRGQQLDHRKHLRGATSAEQRIHDKIIEMRDSYVAHAGETNDEMVFTIAILNPDLSAKGVVGVGAVCYAAVSRAPAIVAEFRGLVGKVIVNVEQALFKAREAVDAQVKAEPIERLYDRAEYPSDCDKVLDGKVD